MSNLRLSALTRHRWLGFMAFVIPLTGAAVFAMSLPGLYRATATVLVQHDPQGSSPGGAGQPADVETRLQTIREEVLSRQRLDALADRFGLYSGQDRRVPREAVIDRMRKDIQIQLKASEQGAAPPGTIAFSLSFRGADPRMTAVVANSLAESYVQENLKIRGRQAKATADALSGQLSDARVRLDEQEARVTRYQAAHNGELPQQLLVNLARMQQLETQLQINRENRLRALDRRDMLGLAAAGSSRNVESLTSQEAPAERLARLRQELADLRTNYSDKYPDVARVKSEISVLEARQKNAPLETSRVPKAVPAPANGDLRSFDSEEARLRREINIYRARVDRGPQMEQEFAGISRDYSTMKDLYSSVLKRYQEAKIAEEMERGSNGSQLRILDPAIAAHAPYAPRRGLLILLGLMASLVFAAGVVALADRLDTSFHTVDDLRSFTRVPVLVSIPPMATRVARQSFRRKCTWMALATVMGIALSGAATWSFAHDNIDFVQLLVRGSSS
jgi:polysaccharide biosynthesis transport protein